MFFIPDKDFPGRPSSSFRSCYTASCVQNQIPLPDDTDKGINPYASLSGSRDYRDHWRHGGLPGRGHAV